MTWIDWTLTLVCVVTVHDAIVRGAYIIGNSIVKAGVALKGGKE